METTDSPAYRVAAAVPVSVDAGSIVDWLTLLGAGAVGAGGGFAYRSLRARTVRGLFAQLESMLGGLSTPIISMGSDPYAALSPGKAVILQGRNKEGKTTRLAAAIPLWRQRGPFALQGLYFNGAKGMSVSTFDMWVTTQMFGQASQGGAEVEAALDAHLARQRVRRAVWFLLRQRTPLICRPVPAVVIVDQLEDLLKRFPEETLGWVNQLTNAHVRDQKARVIFVVNSDAAVRTVLALNQGDRWKVVAMAPPDVDSVRGLLDEAYFEKVQRNIGLYKEAKQRGIEEGDVEAFATRMLEFWKEQFHVPYPLLADKSWRAMNAAEFEEALPRAVEHLLRSETQGNGRRKFNEDEVQCFVDVVASLVNGRDKADILSASLEKWEAMLAAQCSAADANRLASRVKRLLGGPAPAPHTVSSPTSQHRREAQGSK